jgi:hypothetical protein
VVAVGACGVDLVAWRHGSGDAGKSARLPRSCPFVELGNQTAAAAASVDYAAHAGLLDDLMARVAPCFARRETRLACRDMVNGLLSELDDYNCWTLAEAAGHASPYRMRHLLCRARCDERQLLDAAADWAAAHLTAGGRG